MVIIDDFLAAEEAAAILTALDNANWTDGGYTAGALADQVKKNEQFADDSPLRIGLANRLLEKLGGHPVFTAAALPHRISPPRFNRYRDGGTYGTHIDGAVMRIDGTSDVMRSDVSATLFLSSPEDYAGGELIVEGRFGAQEIKLDAGSMVVYPSTSLHMVAPVTSGERIAAIFWVQSMIRNDDDRTALFDFDQAIQVLDENSPSRLALSGVYHNLIRRWAEI